MPLAPYAKKMRVPRDNDTMYVFAGWFSHEQCTNIASMRGMVLPEGTCPYDYTWPVKGRGVIVMDYTGMDQMAAMTLGEALKDAGAEEVIWQDFARQDTNFLIKG